MNEDEDFDLPHLIDRAVKALFRECPTIVTRLAGLSTAAEDIRVEDPNLNLPELRADHVFVLPEGAIYLEYQLRPDPNLLSSWAVKWAGLSRQLGIPVILLVLYLQKGDYATFPAQMQSQIGAFRTALHFTAIRLWEQTERIRNGELTELAPLLLLTEENPTEATVREEVRLIRNAQFPSDVQTELLGIALLVATRKFARSLLEEIFAEDLETMEDLGIIGDWLQKREARGMAQGETNGIRKTAQFVLGQRFGDLPPALVEQIGQADAEWCNILLGRAMKAGSVAELADLYVTAPE